MPAITLPDLQQQIATRERELQTLRQQLESRQSHLSELTRRKAELQRQLQQLEKEITALAGATPIEGAPPEPPAPSAPVTPAPAVSRGVQPRLGELIVTLLRQSSGPMTARQLSEEARRRGFPPASRDPVKAVEARLQVLKNKGVVRRAASRPGYLLAPSADGARLKKSKAHQSAQTTAPKEATKQAKPKPAPKKGSGKDSSSSRAAKTATLTRRGGQPILREVLTDILKNSRKLLTGSELAKRALAAGYKTNSVNFVDTVWSMLGQMENVEHVPHKGYRLKKS